MDTRLPKRSQDGANLGRSWVHGSVVGNENAESGALGGIRYDSVIGRVCVIVNAPDHVHPKTCREKYALSSFCTVFVFLSLGIKR